MKNAQTYLIGCLMLLFLIFGQLDLQAQCAMCKTAAETSLKANPNSIARGLNSGILYLMAVPYLAIMFIFRKQLLVLWKRLASRITKA
ncbi:MAG: hypothetical protein PSX36_10940 [bacterium]|nr:hypothetical protein [bacterium]